MDLRSIINNSSEAGERPAPKQTAPVTPIQAPPQSGFRDYGHPAHASPSKHPSQDYGSHAGGVAYSPKTYQGAFPGRPPPPPPIQAPPQNELRSPARSFSAQSPYQHTPSSTVSGGAGGGGQYPFPPSHHQTPQSPAQHQPYQPNFPQRDSYPHANPSAPHAQQNPQLRASPAPQTPPVGVPGAPHPYLPHQRSQSSVSNSTPTSAQSQHPQYPQYPPHDSPVTSHQYPPAQYPQHARQQSQHSQHSQPGTPLGPPLTQRQSSGTFTQPSSPYQQRAAPPAPYPPYQQVSPAPAPQRLPSTPTPYEVPRAQSVEQQHRRSQSERERSVSVSPKTRVPSYPQIENPIPHYEANNAPKRKLEERESPAEVPRYIGQADPSPQVNGDRRITPASTVSPQPPSKKRIRYTEPPIWARSVRAKNGQTFAPNGRGPGSMGAKPSPMPPAPVRHETNGSRHHSPDVARMPPAPNNIANPHPSALLGNWEECITGVKPAESMVTEIADFLFVNVISRSDMGELASRGVDIEIEAKLGQFIDAGDRVALGVTSECVMAERRQVSFRSAMTEHQHQFLNEWLNKRVAEVHPNNPGRSKKRVGIVYVHRREVDKFYDLPSPVVDSLPPAIRQQIGNRSARLRVTYDQKTNQILGKIVKVRIADMSLHFPRQPVDCRISVNFEMRFEGDIDAIIAQSQSERHNDRSKDRLSYTQGPYQVDLTQVSMTKPHNGIDYLEKEHELEVELDTNAVLEQGRRAMSDQPNEYLALVEGMLSNIRALARNVPPY